MSQTIYLPVLALLGLLLLTACGSALAPTVAPAPQPTAVPPTAVPPTAALPTAVPPSATSPAPTPTAAPPTAVPPTATTAPENRANADVIQVRAVQEPGGTWTFYVTVQHPDTGWEDYADGWDVVLPDGRVLKPDPDSPFTRLLVHPHVEEQPFTRSQSGILIPEGVTQVRVRAHDLVDGYGGREVEVDLTVASGPGFRVERQP